MQDDTLRQLELKYLERRIPRYTSYPTAVQFTGDVDGGTYADWLTALAPDAALSVYLHVPFCAELCLYCGCHTTVARGPAPVAAYVDLLEREIALIGTIVGHRRATHIHWGGGTPTIMTPAEFTRLMTTLREKFAIAADAELAIEIDPRTLTRDYARTLADAGINRVSLGVQDFDGQVQRAVGRMQSFEQTARVADWLREAGITAINLDLMYGLPYQTERSVAASIGQALTLMPDRIAMFGYAHVPWMKRHQKLIPEQALPDGTARFAQSRIAAETIAGAGFSPIGLDHFARHDDPLARRQSEGRLHRNFQGYTADQSVSLIGLGTSAIGSLPQGYAQNAPSTVAYRAAITAGRLATVRGCAVTAEDRLRRDVIERLMCDLSVDLAAVGATHGVDAGHFARELAGLDELEQDGLVTIAGQTITVPEYGRPFVRAVCAAFDRYLDPGDTRFSRAS
jgi:oxygen-independent coproporphyrinogen-3 oxidase